MNKNRSHCEYNTCQCQAYSHHKNKLCICCSHGYIWHKLLNNKVYIGNQFASVRNNAVIPKYNGQHTNGQHTNERRTALPVTIKTLAALNEIVAEQYCPSLDELPA